MTVPIAWPDVPIALSLRLSPGASDAGTGLSAALSWVFGPSREVWCPGGGSLTFCSSTAVLGVRDWGRPPGGRELPSLTLRSSIEDARESMVASAVLLEPCVGAWLSLAAAARSWSSGIFSAGTPEYAGTLSSFTCNVGQHRSKAEDAQEHHSDLPSVFILKLLLARRPASPVVALLSSGVQLGWAVRYTTSGVDTRDASALITAAPFPFLSARFFEPLWAGVPIAPGAEAQAPITRKRSAQSWLMDALQELL